MRSSARLSNVTVRYNSQIDPDAPNNSHFSMIRFVGTGNRVLEVGCAGGRVTRHLVDRGNEVVGIEIDPDAAVLAREFAGTVHVADLDLTSPTEFLAGEEFDVILLGDVLEHFRDPVATLTELASVLRPSGHLVVSVPNVAHIDVRMMLLGGSWAYQEYGLLDRTHLRWFTRSSLRELLAEVGFVATEVDRTTVPYAGTGLPVHPDLMSTDLERLIRADPEAETFQFIVKAELITEERLAADALADGPPIEWPDLMAERRELDARIAALDEQCEALTNEVDAWQRSRIVRYSAPLRRASTWARSSIRR